MLAWSSETTSAVASFAASLVECVEALTVVLAVGVVRDWRSALLGTGSALALLLALVLGLGRSLSGVPLPALQFVVGVLLLMFGLRWLRKAVLRAAGALPLRDEAAAYARHTEHLRGAGEGPSSAVDPIAFIAAFKAVLLEGIEVVFIVIALGAGGRTLVPASFGAALALGTVVALALVLHRPLSRIPENWLKFGVGVMLTAFGTYWVGEGIGLHWPGEDASIVALMLACGLLALGLVKVFGRRLHATVPKAARPASAPGVAKPHRVIAELFGLFVEDRWLAAGIVVWTLGGRALVAHAAPTSAGFAFAFACAGPLLLWASVAGELRRARNSGE